MEFSPKTKKELKKILAEMGDSQDSKEMAMLETSDISDTLERNNKDLKIAISQLATLYQKAIENMQAGLLKGLDGLKTAMESNIKAGKEPDWSGFFKDMPTMLSQIGDNTGKTSELIRNLKWNASQQLRDTNGSPINPAIAGFGITATYDEIQLSDYDGDGNVGTVTYLQADQVKAVLELTYVGGNLTDVQRTT